MDILVDLTTRIHELLLAGLDVGDIAICNRPRAPAVGIQADLQVAGSKAGVYGPSA
jgi:hypothetical protein